MTSELLQTITPTLQPWQIVKAKNWVAGELELNAGAIPVKVAVAYVIKHYDRGGRSGWEGFIWPHTMEGN
jgi:hypothetical protein